MSNVHVLDRNVSGYQTLVFHVAVPNTNNSVGVNWRSAVLNSNVGGKTVLKDGDGTAGTIDATEKANIGTGAVCEVVLQLKDRDLNGLNLTQINAKYSGTILAGLQDRLNKFGAAGG